MKKRDWDVDGHFFRSQEAYISTLGTKMIKAYDLSVRAREEHDESARYNVEGQRIKATREEIKLYWMGRLRYKNFEGVKEITGKVVNPWMRGDSHV